MPLQPLTARAVVILVLVFAAFGAQQTAVKAVVDDMAPLTQTFLRSLGGTALLALWFLHQRRNPFRAPAGPSMALGLLFALDFGFLYVGLALTSAAHAAVIYYSAPMMIALGAMYLIRDEPVRRFKVLGILFAFLGVGLTAFSGAGGGGAATLAGDLLCFVGAVCWAATVMVIRATGLRDLDAPVVLFHQLFGSVPLLGLATLVPEGGWTVHWSPALIASLAFQTVGVAFLGYLVFFAMLRRHYTSQVSAMNFLAPLFGVVFAVVLLGENQNGLFWLGAAAIVGGLCVVNQRRAGHPA
ncbi:DMT family transporter [Alloalcanivorax marinus]|uniref:DMT family transporter n=1 Tax=Alloalcanivorax marinus TaxID=1177169 RepID=UPI0021D2460E|nr:DMT family transporter [Alloalcanivorax marinus]MCU5786984.1 hypothetical protein [Alloalcanivorax marinus]